MTTEKKCTSCNEAIVMVQQTSGKWMPMNAADPSVTHFATCPQASQHRRREGTTPMISFAWTTPALLAGEKTCTRREWAPGYARQFLEQQLVAAYDRQPRFGGKRIATVRLLVKPYLESTARLPDADWKREGFEYLTEIGAKVNKQTPAELWRDWKDNPREMWVVRFELVSVEAGVAVPSREPTAQPQARLL